MPMPTERKFNYAPLYALLAIMAICVLRIFGSLISEPILRGQLLDSFETEFQALSHPPGTELLAFRSAIGNFNDHAQGCDLFIGEVRRSTLSETEIRADYATQVVKEFPVRVALLDGDKLLTNGIQIAPEVLRDLSEWQLPAGLETQSLYIVYLSVEAYADRQKLKCR